jgi:drug/metabolite transporter (DMT)-like permease
MRTEYLLYIVLSAFLHSFYNLLMRKSGGSRVFLVTMFTVAGFTAVGVAFITGNYKDIPWHNVPYIYGASFFYILYQVFVSKAYEHGDISAHYPLTVLSPIFIPIWAYFLLAEKISLMTGAGIVITIIGAFTVKLNKLTWAEIKKIFLLSRDYRGARFALAASFMYSFGAIFDKSRIATFNIETYIGFILLFMAFNLIIYTIIFRQKPVFSYIPKYWYLILLGGITVFLSFFTFRVALREVMVSVAVPVRQVSIVFAIMLGIIMLREKPGINKLIGSLIIIGGIILVNLGIK